MATDSSKSGEHPLYCRDATGKYPLGYAMRPLNHLLPPMSYITNQRFAEPAGPSLNNLYCLENVFRKMTTLSWPWYLWCDLNEGIANYPRMHLERVRGEQYRWTTRLDVNHFSPSELSVKTKDGFLEISGKHEERRDTHGSISRRFTRKYKIPIGIDSENIRSTLSCDGILSVEAPLTPPPHRIIPVQFEKEPLMTGMKNRKDPRTDEASNEGINVQREGEREEKSEGEREGERQGSEVGSLMDSTEMASSESPERPMPTNREADNDRSRDRQEHRTSAHASDIPGSLTSPEGRSEAGGIIDERHGEKDKVAKAEEEQGEEEEEKREEERSGEEKLSQDETTSTDGRDQFVDLSEAATTHREAEERHEGDLQSEGTSGEEVVGEEALDCGQLQQLMFPQQEVLENLLSLDQEAI